MRQPLLLSLPLKGVPFLLQKHPLPLTPSLHPSIFQEYHHKALLHPLHNQLVRPLLPSHQRRKTLSRKQPLDQDHFHNQRHPLLCRPLKADCLFQHQVKFHHLACSWMVVFRMEGPPFLPISYHIEVGTRASWMIQMIVIVRALHPLMGTHHQNMEVKTVEVQIDKKTQIKRGPGSQTFLLDVCVRLFLVCPFPIACPVKGRGQRHIGRKHTWATIFNIYQN
mmetsp:Transcript_37059/g.60026  ORF Transcript_37059/g.60026 Transcript_37059/m.60026 type:complete len:222 (-) Transcript_37059:1552-2217(-)